MIPADELKLRIVAQLEEAGNDHIARLMIEVMDRTGDAIELVLMQEALVALVQEDLARISTSLDGNRRLMKLSQSDSLSVIADLPNWVHFDAKLLCWWDSRDGGPPYLYLSPEVVLTAAGYQRGRQVMEERGYQWWRAKK